MSVELLLENVESKWQIETNLQVYAVHDATPGWLGCWQVVREDPGELAALDWSLEVSATLEKVSGVSATL